METSATLKGVRISPQKLRVVANKIRGVSASKALDMLEFSPLKAAKLLKKVLLSAIANAEHNDSADVDELVLSTIYINKGTVLKRMRPRAKGRGARILKPTSHITVKVSEGES